MCNSVTVEFSFYQFRKKNWSCFYNTSFFMHSGAEWNNQAAQRNGQLTSQNRGKLHVTRGCLASAISLFDCHYSGSSYNFFVIWRCYPGARLERYLQNGFVIREARLERYLQNGAVIQMSDFTLSKNWKKKFLMISMVLL